MRLIKEKLLGLYTKNVLKAHKIPRRNVGFKQAKLIGLLYTQEDLQKKELIQQFIDQLQATGKTVAVLPYVATKNQAFDEGFPGFTQHAINYWGQLLDGQLADFVNTAFDYLYHLDFTSDPILDYLLAKSLAKCRVGNFDLSRANLFEIMVKCEHMEDKHALEHLTDQMIYYTQLLGT